MLAWGHQGQATARPWGEALQGALLSSWVCAEPLVWRVLGELETMEAQENSQVGIRVSPPKRGRFRVPTKGHLQQCKQEGLGKQQENCCHRGGTVG